MKPEHGEIIEAMAEQLSDYFETAGFNDEAIAAALRAAAERGWVLAKIPERKSGYETNVGRYGAEVWNACLDAIETIELEDGDG